MRKETKKAAGLKKLTGKCCHWKETKHPSLQGSPKRNLRSREGIDPGQPKNNSRAYCLLYRSDRCFHGKGLTDPNVKGQAESWAGMLWSDTDLGLNSGR